MDGRAGLHADPAQQEAFVAVEAACGREGDDVLIKLRQDQIAVCRNTRESWQGVVLKDDCVLVRTADGAWIKIEADGTVTRQTETDEATFHATGRLSPPASRRRVQQGICSGWGQTPFL